MGDHVAVGGVFGDGVDSPTCEAQSLKLLAGSSEEFQAGHRGLVCANAHQTVPLRARSAGEAELLEDAPVVRSHVLLDHAPLVVHAEYVDEVEDDSLAIAVPAGSHTPSAPGCGTEASQLAGRPREQLDLGEGLQIRLTAQNGVFNSEPFYITDAR